MTTDFRALCVELVESVEVLLALRPPEARTLWKTEDRLTRARAALAGEPTPSLAEESLALIVKIQNNEKMWQLEELDVVRRALERLQELENNG